jgi:hypothetical protein
MICFRAMGVCAIVATVGLTAAFAFQDKKPQEPKDKGKAEKAPSKEDAEMMAKWMAFATPGAEHKVLDPKVGKWTTHVKWFQDPATPPQESDGTGELKWIMGGRYLHDEEKGSMMGMPFEGMGVTGYDNMKKTYVSTWVDNFGTGIMTSEGTWDAAKKTMTYKSEGPDVMTGKYMPMRMVETMTGPDSWKMEMFGPGKDGKEMRSMEITYTRAK